MRLAIEKDNKVQLCIRKEKTYEYLTLVDVKDILICKRELQVILCDYIDPTEKKGKRTSIDIRPIIGSKGKNAFGKGISYSFRGLSPLEVKNVIIGALSAD